MARTAQEEPDGAPVLPPYRRLDRVVIACGADAYTLSTVETDQAILAAGRQVSCGAPSCGGPSSP
ncbi:hypothetical protein [Microvirga massiliensis]|uniref:hypothetical protein n=1 Tax=Microvirga massiliensis TaxID=1033741 RepID=UPI00062B33CB|nr:hypothetical protein [Microvirga massiliensis]